MKKILLFLSIILIMVITAHAQKNIEVKWGPELKSDKRSSFVDFIGEDEQGFYVLKSTRKGYTIQKYSKDNLSLLLSNDFEMPEVGRDRVSLFGIYQIEGKMLMFSTLYQKKELQQTIYVQEISADGVPNSKYKKIDEYTYEEKKNHGGFDLAISPDKSKFLLYRGNTYDKHANEQFSYKVFDNTFNILWEKSFELPYRDKVVSLFDVKLSNEGNVYLSANISPDRKKGEKYERRIQNEKYNIFAYYPETDALRQYEIDLGTGKWVSDITYTINTEGNVQVGGFYSNEGSSSMDGTFFLTIDKDSKEVESKNLKEFDREFLLNFMKEKHVDKGRELGVFDLSDIILRDDGGVIFVAEYYRFYTTTVTDQNGNTRTTYHYLYNDIITINVDPDGTIDWISHIPKKQHTTNDIGYYSSYSLIVNKDKLHFIFNDNPKNIQQYEKDPRKLKDMTNPRKSISMLSTIDADGNVRRAPLFQAKDFKTILRPQFYYELEEDGKVIIFGVKGSKYKFGKIDFTNY